MKFLNTLSSVSFEKKLLADELMIATSKHISAMYRHQLNVRQMLLLD